MRQVSHLQLAQHNTNLVAQPLKVTSADGGIGIGPAQSPQAPGKLLGHHVFRHCFQGDQHAGKQLESCAMDAGLLQHGDGVEQGVRVVCTKLPSLQLIHRGCDQRLEKIIRQRPGEGQGIEEIHQLLGLQILKGHFAHGVRQERREGRHVQLQFSKLRSQHGSGEEATNGLLCGQFWSCLGQAIEQHRQQGLEHGSFVAHFGNSPEGV
mmetsp:Transcript_53329/g.116405  ORF Transcript_53329/g.116405 Transcript_53329/m.116405 type:complete len:208 (-) Transcript_53329:634-1257(-)